MADKTVPLSDKSQTPDFEAELPLPLEDRAPTKSVSEESDPTLDLIRKKLGNTYESEPDVIEEEKQAEVAADKGQRLSKHQKFLAELAESGKPITETQMAWHEYYAALSDEEKRQVWQEFNETHKTVSKYHKESEHAKDDGPHPSAFRAPNRRSEGLNRVLKEAKRQTLHTVAGAKQLSAAQGLKSLGFGLGAGAIVLVIFLFGLFNERFIAPLIQPSRSATSASIITGGSVGKTPELIIPKINLEVPVVYGVTTTTEKDVQKALQNGVVHYADTAQPGQNGNLVIVGHSSNNILNPGKYKFAFVLLHKLAVGDTFYLHKDGIRYVYQVYDRRIVPPSDTTVLGLQAEPATATLITCDPPGTTTNRLLVIGKQITPALGSNKPSAGANISAVSSPVLPGNSPSLWSRLFNWLTH